MVLLPLSYNCYLLDCSSIFHQSVVLLLNADDLGGRGVILNKPLPQGWTEGRTTEEKRGDESVWVGLGGPLLFESTTLIYPASQQRSP